MSGSDKCRVHPERRLPDGSFSAPGMSLQWGYIFHFLTFSNS